MYVFNWRQVISKIIYLLIAIVSCSNECYFDSSTSFASTVHYWAASCTYYGRDTICTLAATKDVWIDSNQGGNQHNFLELTHHWKRSSLHRQEMLSDTIYLRTTINLQTSKVDKNVRLLFTCSQSEWQNAHVAPYIPRELEFHQILKSWSETQVTATHRFRSVRWNHTDVAIGLDGTDAMAYSQGEGEVMFPGQPPRYVQFDITDASRNWLSGKSNYGLRLLVYATNEDVVGYDLRFHSQEKCHLSHPWLLLVLEHHNGLLNM